MADIYSIKPKTGQMDIQFNQEIVRFRSPLQRMRIDRPKTILDQAQGGPIQMEVAEV